MGWLDEMAAEHEDDARDRVALEAYRQAWRARATEGDDRSTLARHLERAGLEEVVRDLGSDDHEFWFRAWDEAVSPGRIGTWGLAQGVRELVEAGTELRSILRELAPPWARVPKGVKAISRTNEVKTKSVTLDVDADVELDPEPACIALLLDVLEPVEKAKVPVWIDVREPSGRAPLMVGEGRLGWVTSVAALPRKVRWGRTFVPDGKATLVLDDASLIEVRRVKVRVWRKK